MSGLQKAFRPPARRISGLLVLGLVALGGSPPPISAQVEAGGVGMSLDSLLNLRVSTAAKYEQAQTDAPAFVTIITREEIQRFGYHTLDDVLQNQAGFYSGNNRQYSDVGFRGVGRPGYYNNKILLLVDGHSLNDSFWGGARLGSALAVDLDAVERIEVVRGPGSAQYGARAMLAVVNLVTRKGRDLDGLEAVGDFGLPRTTGGGLSFGRVLGVDSDLFASVSMGSGDGEDVFFPEFDAPILGDGVAKDLDWENWVRGLASVRVGGLFLQAGLARRDKGIPTAPFRSSFSDPRAESRDRVFFGESRYSRSFGTETEVTLRGFGDLYQNHSLYPHDGIYGGNYGGVDAISAGLVSNRISTHSLGGEARVRWDPAPNQRIVFGMEAQRILEAEHRFSTPISEPVLVKVPYSILSAYLHEELQITPTLSLTLGLRRDEYSTKGSATTPRGALVYHLSKASTLKLMAGEAFRAPNVFELHVSLPAAGLLSNPELEPEKIRNLEMVWEHRSGRYSATVSGFLNQARNLIQMVQGPPPDSLVHLGRLAYQQQNIARSRALGFEVEARVDLPRGILAHGGYGLTDAVDRGTEGPMVNSPRHSVRFGASGGWEGIGKLGLNVRFDSGRRTIYGTDTDPMMVTDLAVSSMSFRDHARIQLIVKNLFDSENAVPGGFQHSQASIPQPGRTLTLRATVAW